MSLKQTLSNLSTNLRRLIDGPEDANEITCPVCGYYCLGNGGIYCIDKPFLVKAQKEQGEGEAND